jgi:hypothetical protein
MIRVKGKVTDKDKGYARLMTELGGLGALTIGIQGKEALEQHPESDLTVGEIGAIHELGLGVPQRSWLGRFMDQNQVRLAAEAKAMLIEVAEGRMSRKKAFEALGYKWVKEVRDDIYTGRITPPLSAGYRNRTGMPLFDTGTMAKGITYVAHLPRNLRVGGKFASERNKAKEALGGPAAFAKTLVGGFPSTSGGSASPAGTQPVVGSPQPPAKSPGRGGRLIGPRLRQEHGGGFYSKRKAPQQGPKQPKQFGPVFRKPKFFGPKLPKGFRRLKPGKARALRANYRRARKSNMLLWLLRKAQMMLRKGKSGGDFRNRGFTNSGKGGRTGRAGFFK